MPAVQGVPRPSWTNSQQTTRINDGYIMVFGSMCAHTEKGAKMESISTEMSSAGCQKNHSRGSVCLPYMVWDCGTGEEGV